MSGYIERLEKLGYSHPDAYYTVEDMMREVGEDGLKDFIEGLEEYVRDLTFDSFPNETASRL